jgi:hypothetical protein
MGGRVWGFEGIREDDGYSNAGILGSDPSNAGILGSDPFMSACRQRLVMLWPSKEEVQNSHSSVC